MRSLFEFHAERFAFRLGVHTGRERFFAFQAFFERMLKSNYRALALWQRGSSLPM